MKKKSHANRPLPNCPQNTVLTSNMSDSDWERFLSPNNLSKCIAASFTEDSATRTDQLLNNATLKTFHVTVQVRERTRTTYEIEANDDDDAIMYLENMTPQELLGCIIDSDGEEDDVKIDVEEATSSIN